MLYQGYELANRAMEPFRAGARVWQTVLQSELNPMRQSAWSKASAASISVMDLMTRAYEKPDWQIIHPEKHSALTPDCVVQKPFAHLLRFDAYPERQKPRVLLVPPLSGHYATLLRGTVKALIKDFEVYVCEWQNARDVPLAAGRFDLNDYIDYLIEFMRDLGTSTHVIGVCQPGPAVLSAVALLSEAKDPATPKSMTIIGSPIDPRESPTEPNRLAESRPYAWFEQNCVHRVPWPNTGVGRQVYPGFLQLAGFMSMNQSRHIDAQTRYFDDLVSEQHAAARKHEHFYAEYLSVLDLSAEFYLQTIRDIFQTYKLPNGTFEHRGQKVDLSAIKQTALMTIEGELDDISGVGQTQAAHRLCSKIPKAKRMTMVQPGAGHYGVFSGAKFREIIYPQMRDFIVGNDS